jgi:NitT/TauT family transport system permease protein
LALQLLFVIAAILFWQFGPLDPSVFSTPRDVIQRFSNLLPGRVVGLDPLWFMAMQTLEATLLGLAGGTLLGFFLAVVLTEFEILREVVLPILAGLNAVPRIAWVPVMTLVFGFGELTNVLLALLIVTLIVFFAVLDAALHSPVAMVNGVTSLGANRWRRIVDVKAWMGIAAVVASLPSCIAFALVGVVFAESLSAEAGLGSLMFNAAYNGNAADLVISAVTLSAIGLALTVIVRVGATRIYKRLPSEFTREA